jgi:hypothetical protein
VSQNIGGGSGNDFLLRQGAPAATVTVAPSTCVTPTNLALTVSPIAISTTDSNATVKMTVTLTSVATNLPIAAEPISFTVGGEPVTCQSPAITNTNGVTTCSYMPQAAPNTPLPVVLPQFSRASLGTPSLRLIGERAPPVRFSLR